MAEHHLQGRIIAPDGGHFKENFGFIEDIERPAEAGEELRHEVGDGAVSFSGGPTRLEDIALFPGAKTYCGCAVWIRPPEPEVVH